MSTLLEEEKKERNIVQLFHKRIGDVIKLLEAKVEIGKDEFQLKLSHLRKACVVIIRVNEKQKGAPGSVLKAQNSRLKDILAVLDEIEEKQVYEGQEILSRLERIHENIDTYLKLSDTIIGQLSGRRAVA